MPLLALFSHHTQTTHVLTTLFCIKTHTRTHTQTHNLHYVGPNCRSHQHAISVGLQKYQQDNVHQNKKQKEASNLYLCMYVVCIRAHDHCVFVPMIT
jgi:hypothetical protein